MWFSRRLWPALSAGLLPVLLLIAGCGSDNSSEQQPAGGTSQPAAAVTTSPVETAAETGPTATAFPLEAGWWDDGVCYEIFVRSFFDSDGDGIGDLKGLASKLDYPNDGDSATQTDLGVNCVWLMPINESPSYHGYDIVDYYTVDKEYGTVDDFKAFVAEAHKRDIHVVIDLVLNHTSKLHPWFREASSNPQSKYRDWYIWSTEDPGYKGPWQQQVWHQAPDGTEFYYGIFEGGMPDLNYRNPEVTEEARKITRFWVEEMGVDGFRLDAIRHLIEDGQKQENVPETHAWLREYRAFLESLDRPVFTIGEVLIPSTVALKEYYPDQLDMYFQFHVADALIKAIRSETGRFFANPLGRSTETLPFQRFAPLLTNHDQTRAMSLFGGDENKARIAATGLLTSPGLPFLYYGEEIGLQGIKAEPPVHDEPMRAPMQWTGESNGGFTSGKPWREVGTGHETMNVATMDADPNSLLNHYRRLIHLHRTEPALGHGSFTALEPSDEAVAAFVRQAEDEAVLVVLNFAMAAKEHLSVTVGTSELAPGTYRAEPLLGDRQGSELTVGDGGAITGYVPLPNLDPQTGYIFKLIK